MPDKTILDLYRYDAEAPREVHYTHHLPGGSRSLSTRDFLHRTAALAAGLAGLGVQRRDRVMLLSENRPEWHMVDLAVLDIGAVDVPVYSTLTPAQIAYQINDSGSVLAVVETPEQMQKLLQVRAQCPTLKHLVQVEGAREAGVVALDDLIADGEKGDVEGRFWQRAGDIAEDDLATIVYTSGTTGDPKGAMLTHRNFVTNALAILPRVPTTPDDLVLEFLPLCHVYERCAGYFFMRTASTKAYCSLGQVGELIAGIAPNTFCAVPRVFEKVYDKVQANVAAAPASRQAIFRWAVRIGGEVARHRLAGTPVPAGLALRHRVADALVLRKVRAALGGRVKGILSGAAPLPLYANEFFHAVGVPIQEAYGLTETSPGVAVSGYQPGTNRLGAVGRALDNLEVKLADDGELLVKGPSVFQGYWNKREQTAEVFDEEGFFHTGDIARIDEDGFVYITDRKKDIIVTAGGKNVAPQPIENLLKQSPLVDTAVVIGDQRPYLVCLISPNLEELEPRARGLGIAVEDRAALVQRREVLDLYKAVVDGVNAGLARYEQIRRFEVLPQPLSQEGGQITPTMKVKRRVVEKQQAQLITALYSGSPPSPGE